MAWADAVAPRRGHLLELQPPPAMPPLTRGVMEAAYTKHYRYAPSSRAVGWEAVVLPAWDGSTTALAGSKSGFGRGNLGDSGPHSFSETGTGRAPAGTTKRFRTALPSVNTHASHTATGKLRIVTLGFRVERAHAAVSRRLPIPLDTVVARTEGCTHGASDWGLSLVQGTLV